MNDFKVCDTVNVYRKGKPEGVNISSNDAKILRHCKFGCNEDFMGTRIQTCCGKPACALAQQRLYDQHSRARKKRKV
jgi:hypothetical protein